MLGDRAICEGSSSGLAITADQQQQQPAQAGAGTSVPLSRYESQKRRDWNTFGQYLKNQTPPVSLSHCNCNHVLEFLRYLDQFGKTRVHSHGCVFFGQPDPCPLPLPFETGLGQPRRSHRPSTCRLRGARWVAGRKPFWKWSH